MALEEVGKEVVAASLGGVSKSDLKEEINYLKKELAKLKYILKLSSSNNLNINNIDPSQNQTTISSLNPKTPLSSTGNEGVKTNRQIDTIESKDMLDTINHLKVDLKQKFRKITKQEFLVFSAIYMLEEQGPVSYPLVSNKLGLSETAIRDYVMKLIRKGIPIVKTKLNNKNILLSIRQELRQLASLDSLVKIRERTFD